MNKYFTTKTVVILAIVGIVLVIQIILNMTI